MWARRGMGVERFGAHLRLLFTAYSVVATEAVDLFRGLREGGRPKATPFVSAGKPLTLDKYPFIGVSGPYPRSISRRQLPLDPPLDRSGLGIEGTGGRWANRYRNERTVKVTTGALELPGTTGDVHVHNRGQWA